MSQASQTTEEIERELAALGEAPPSADELAWVASENDENHASDTSDEVAGFARLSELATPFAFDDLSQLETHRAWRNVEARLDGDRDGDRHGDRHGDRQGDKDAAAPAHDHTPSGGSSPRRWLFAAVGLAAAAALVVIVLGPGPDAGPSASEVQALGEQVRASLRVLDDGKTDTQRASELAAQYQRRLAEAHGGQGPSEGQGG